MASSGRVRVKKLSAAARLANAMHDGKLNGRNGRGIDNSQRNTQLCVYELLLLDEVNFARPQRPS